MAEENESEASKAFQYGCSFCDKKFQFQSQRKKHEVVHSSSKDFSCDFCSKEFRRKDDRTRHIKLYHMEEIKPTSSQVTYENDSHNGLPYDLWSNINKLINNDKFDTTENSESINDMGNEFKEQLNKVIDNTRIQPKNDDLTGEYTLENFDISSHVTKCMFCDTESETKEINTLHILTKHADQLSNLQTQLSLLQQLLDQISSPRTDQSAVTSSTATSSLADLLPLTPNLQSTNSESDDALTSDKHRLKTRGKFPCHFCDKNFTCYSHMKKHEIVHSDKKPFKCEFCEKYFRRKYDCTRHMKVVHIQKLLKRKNEIMADDNAAKISEECDSGSEPVCVIPADPPRKMQKIRNKDNYRCSECDKSFSCFSHLKRHEIMHTDEKPFNCEFCQKEFRRKYDRNRHVNHVHIKPLAKLKFEEGLTIDSSSGETKPTQLDTDYSESSILQSELSGLTLWNLRHEMEKAEKVEEKHFKCKFCDSRFRRNYDRNRHEKMSHLDQLNAEVKMECLSDTNLSHLIETAGDVRMHSPSSSPDEVEHNEDSDSKLSEKSEKIAHVKKMEIFKLSGTEKSTSKIEQSGGLVDAEVNSDTSSIETIIPFSEHDFKSENIDSLTEQNDFKTEDHKYHCAFCEKSFACQSQVKNHEIIHSDEKPYVCEICDRAFRRKYDKNRHVQLIHKMEKIELGDVQSFADSLLKKNKGPHDCHSCQKSFSCLSHLRNHEVVHSEERPFRCEICDKGFRRKYDKNRHVALVHVQKVEKNCLRDEYVTPDLGYSSEFSLQTYISDAFKRNQIENSKRVAVDTIEEDVNDESESLSVESANIITEQSEMLTILPEAQSNKHMFEIEKPFYCTHCPKSFPYLSHLKKHQVIHFEDKPFTCGFCEKSFRRQDVLIRHQENVHYNIGRSPHVKV